MSVYFIAGAGLVKIGVAGDVEKRLATLQCGSPVPLRILGVSPGGIAEERAIHERFARLRRHGEWFAEHPDLLAFITENAPSTAAPSPQPRAQLNVEQVYKIRAEAMCADETILRFAAGYDVRDASAHRITTAMRKLGIEALR